MANSVAINNMIILNVGYTFTGAPMSTFPVKIYLDGSVIPLTTLTATVATLTTVGLSPATIISIPAGNHTVVLSFDINQITPTDGGAIGDSTLKFTYPSGPDTTTGNLPFDAGVDPQTLTNAYIATGFIIIACIHGSSLVQMKDGLKRIDQIKPGDEVLSGENLDKYTKVVNVAHCWLSLKGIAPDGGDCDAIIFEPGSLGENEPTQRLIIDPGHPMCTRKEYLEKGYDALRPAGSFWEELKGDKVYTKKWTDELVQEDPSRRYDLVLENPFNTYLANGIVVRAKGYKDHRYKQFV
jgi:hypothetical protein